MVGRKRTVYFFTGAEIDDKGNTHEWTSRKWSSFLINSNKRQAKYFLRNKSYEGDVGKNRNPAAMYFHLVRPRDLSDWPEGKDKSNKSQNLGANKQKLGLNEIDEYAYLLPVDGTNYVAVFRSSGGPRPAAMADWIAENLDLAKTGATFVLMPVLRTNASAKLKSATGVRSLHVRFEGQTQGHSGSKIQDAVALAGSGEGDYGDLAIDMTVSLGRSVKSGPATTRLLKQATELVKGVGGGLRGATLTKLVAKTLQKKDDKNDQNVTVEQVDFFKERITVQTEFGDADDAMDPQQIISGMKDAIKKFRAISGEY